MSASNSAVLNPFRASAIARLAATVDFPTPPFPDANCYNMLYSIHGSFSNRLLIFNV